ncbi:MAG: hypothetical protein ABI556_13110 [Gemmatimonadales bacterium]
MKTLVVSALNSGRFVIALGGALVGCSDAVGSAGLPGGVEIRAETTVFGIAIINGEKTSVVSVSLVNNGLTSVFVNYCGARVYKRVDNDWVEVWAEECGAVEGTFLELPRSGVTTVSRLLSNPASPFSFGGPFKFETGVYYRMSVPLLVKTGDGPEDFRLINPRESMSTAFAFTLTL